MYHSILTYNDNSNKINHIIAVTFANLKIEISITLFDIL